MWSVFIPCTGCCLRLSGSTRKHTLGLGTTSWHKNKSGEILPALPLPSYHIVPVIICPHPLLVSNKKVRP